MAIATQLLASGRGVSGSAFFVEGMSSASDPMFISDRSYRHGENIIHRGGALRTRPGYRQVFTLPTGKLQGASYFRPISGEGHLVDVVAGKLYATPFPFTAHNQVANVQLYPYASRAYFASAVRSARRNADGTIDPIEPTRTLIVQDGGYTRAAYWDGVSSGHLDPTVVVDGSGNVLTAGTPLGSVMCWSGDRLWVARKNKLFAGDISDPFSFVENEYAGEGGFFAFDEDITALAEVPSLSDPVLLVYTATKTYQILSSIRARDTWKDTKNFKSVLFPGVGCVSQRSIVTQNGMLWWMSVAGLTNLNSAQQSKVSSKLAPMDAAMALSKANVSSDLSVAALAAHENFLLCSVPYASKYNTHTWVYDQSVVDGQGESWAGVWTGTRPVEWVTGLFGGTPRIFQYSVDVDGVNRTWESFVSDRTDNGSPIESFVETKTHIDFSQKATGLDLKQFIFAEVSFSEILRDVEVSVYWAGTRGKYKKLADYTLVATPGSLEANTIITAEGGVSTHRSQQRVLRAPEVKLSGDCTSCAIESTNQDWLDVGFSLLVRWTGNACLRSYRIFVDPKQESGTGVAATIEVGPKVLAGAVCE